MTTALNRVNTDLIALSKSSTGKAKDLAADMKTIFDVVDGSAASPLKNITNVADAAYSVATTDAIVKMGTLTAARIITIDTDNVEEGRIFEIKDASGNADQFPITIATEAAETIDGAASIEIREAFGSFIFYCDGTNFFVLNPPAQGAHYATLVAGATSDTLIVTAVQFLDGYGNDMAEAVTGEVYLASDSAGLAFETSGPDGTNGAGTDGDMVEILADTVFRFTSEADGDLDVSLAHAGGADTYFLVWQGPTGRLFVSDAIIFT